MDYRMFKIYNQDDFQRITHGIKVAQCMRSKSSAVSDTITEIQQLEELTVSDSLSCSFCSTIFENQIQQRLHYKLDWHRYNLKQRLRGYKSIAECEFNILLDKDDLSSISGAESASEDENETESNETSGTPKASETDSKNGKSSSGKSKITAKKTKVGLSSNSSDSDDDRESLRNRRIEVRLAIASRHSKVFFENANGDIFSIYRCILHNKKDIPEIDDDIITQAIESGKKSLWTIVMVGGGHFAAAIFEGGEAIVHKTFHSYTVRAKQGSSQSSRDNRSSSGHSKSAGASLRRYNEQKLLQHVQEIMESWSPHIINSSLILYRAVGPQNRMILFGGKNPPLNKSDLRLRAVPFPTKRATFNEVKRVHDILTTMEIYGQATDFIESFPVSPRQPIRKKTSKSDEISEVNVTSVDPASSSSPPEQSKAKGLFQITPDRQRCLRSNIDRAKPRKSPNRPLPDIVTQLAKSSSESECGSLLESEILMEFTMMEDEHKIDFQDQLIEFEDKGGRNVSKRKKNRSQRKPNGAKHPSKEPSNDILTIAKRSLWIASRTGDVETLNTTWESLINEIQRCEEYEKTDTKCPVTVKMADALEIINECDQEGNTMLHLAAINNYIEILQILLELGSNPSKKNNKSQTAYAAATKDEARDALWKFMADNPDKFHCNEQVQTQAKNTATDLEKKKQQRKLKREREKIKKREFELKKKEEQAKQRFLNLSDREKRALEAERRFQDGSGLISRCFQCGTDITGIIAFEYNTNRFCSMPCLKEHRLHNKFIL